MKMSGNTILITGGGSGIGLALAEEFSKLDNKVIVAGRTSEKLKAAAAKGFATLAVDMANAESITSMAQKAINDFPTLNMVIHNAGIMKYEKILENNNHQIETETVATNLLGPMRLTDALVPHFLKQKSSVIMTVTSGLAFMPLAWTPTYSATKAGLHSYTESLRYQLKDTKIEVLELAPPYVQTELTGKHQASDPDAMPLNDFINEVMQILKSEPNAREILVKKVIPLRTSSEGGQAKYQEFFNGLNDYMSKFV
ncbi:MAG: SDR family oxidoreductase [Bacteriovoracaceae bacterium]